MHPPPVDSARCFAKRSKLSQHSPLTDLQYSHSTVTAHVTCGSVVYIRRSQLVAREDDWSFRVAPTFLMSATLHGITAAEQRHDTRHLRRAAGS